MFFKIIEADGEAHEMQVMGHAFDATFFGKKLLLSNLFQGKFVHS